MLYPAELRTHIRTYKNYVSIVTKKTSLVNRNITKGESNSPFVFHIYQAYQRRIIYKPQYPVAELFVRKRTIS